MEILIIPDLASMNRAIENHVVEHTNNDPNQAKSASERNRIREQLIAKVLEKINGSE